ncbi:MAG: hypothetical protein ABW164_08105 [Sphingobium sp.]
MSDDADQPAVTGDADNAVEQARIVEEQRQRLSARKIWGGAAVGVGSAALVAALLYARRK